MSGIQMTLLAAGGGALDVQTVTTGGSGSPPSQDRLRGFSSPSLGSIVDGTSNIYGGATISNLFWDENLGSPYYYLAIVGATNSGWTTLTIGSKTLNRVDATFSAGANWFWNTTDIALNQAFGPIGTVVTCTFT